MKRSVSIPIGALTLYAEEGALVAVDWQDEGAGSNDPALLRAETELAEYFAGARQGFTGPFAPRGTEFQRAFCQALLEIPFGETLEYGDLAKKLGVSAQAIGQACGANPLPIFIPCHRVLAANGLGGYSGRGGVEAKVALLRLEGAASLLI